MRKSLLSSSLIALAIAVIPATVMAFGPDRTTYTCPSTTSCPGTDHVTFNSFTNNPNYGDERNFFRAKNADSSNPGFTNGTVNVDDGNAVLMQAFVHNDANPLNANSTAHNTQVSFTLPTDAANSQTVTSGITASNATPKTVSDTVTFNASKPFTLAFDTSSDVNVTQRTDNGNGDFAITPTVAFTINGNVMTVDLGDFSGGFKNHILITIRAKVVYASTAQPSSSSSSTSTSATTLSTPAALVCNNATVSPTDNSHATVTVAPNGIQNANISSYAFTVKNGSGTVIDSPTQASNVYNFSQSTPGTYTITAVINTDHGSTPVSADCTRQIVVSAQPVTLSSSTTVTTQPAATTSATAKATTLPNTGPGEVAGLFAGTSALGGAGHYLVRRFRR